MVVSPPAGACIPSFTIYHVLPDLPGAGANNGTSYGVFTPLKYKVIVHCTCSRELETTGVLRTVVELNEFSEWYLVLVLKEPQH
jgi:hypothetical protein